MTPTNKALNGISAEDEELNDEPGAEHIAPENIEEESGTALGEGGGAKSGTGNIGHT